MESNPEQIKKPNPEEIYYYGSDLTVPHIKRVSEAIQAVLDQDLHAVRLQWFLRKDEWVNTIAQERNYSQPKDEVTKRTITDLWNIFVDKFQWIADWVQRLSQWSSYPPQTDQKIRKTIAELHDIFLKVFHEVASQKEHAWIDYNTPLLELIWLNILFGPQIYIQWAESGERKNYWINESFRRAQTKPIKKKKVSKTVWLERDLAADHRIFNLDTYDELQEFFFFSMNKVIEKYIQKFDINRQDHKALAYFLNKYFSFIFFQSLFDAFLIFECRSKKWNQFVAQVLEDTKEYLQEHYNVCIDVETNHLKKKLFTNTRNDDVWPIELMYENALLQDIEEREKYFNRHYLIRRWKNMTSLRSEIMDEYKWWLFGIDKTFEVRNPGYYHFQQKIDSAKERLNKIEPWEKQEVLPLLPPIFKEIEKFKIEQKPFTTSTEEHPITQRDPSPTLLEVQQQFLKKYNIPFQFRIFFAIVVHKNNHFLNLRSRRLQKTDEYNKLIQQIFLYKWAPDISIIHQLHEIVTDKEFQFHLENAWKKKRQEREQKIKNKVLPSFQTASQINARRKADIKKWKVDMNQYEIPFGD